jgi:predicted HTH domain antitoxin
MTESKNLCLQKSTSSETISERKVESAWPGKATGRDTVNATISMRTDFLVGTGKVRALQTFNYRGCKTEIGGKAMSKTMSIRMDRDNYEFLHEITKEERSDLSKAVRDLVTRGRILLAVERYKKGEASLGRAAELAGLPLGQMITILTEFGVESRLEKEDYLQGLRNLHKVW